MIKTGYINLGRDQHGYASHNDPEDDTWNGVCQEHNDAFRAFHLSLTPDHNRLIESELDLSKLRRQIEDRLRKSNSFLYDVAVLFDNL